MHEAPTCMSTPLCCTIMIELHNTIVPLWETAAYTPNPIAKTGSDIISNIIIIIVH